MVIVFVNKYVSSTLNKIKQRKTHFSIQCIQQHLQVSLTEGKVLNLECLSSSCDFEFTEPILEHFLTEKQFNRYQQFLLAATIRADPNKKCCPVPDCSGLLTRNQNLDYQTQWASHPFTICDKCETKTCFECVRNYHPNQTCKEYEHELRLKQLLTDEENMKRWQTENNAKPCPRCKVSHHYSHFNQRPIKIITVY